MQISVTKSKLMDSEVEKCPEERKKIRIPAKYREELSAPLNSFLNVTTKNKEIISLLVEKAHKEEALENENTTFVTSDVYNLIVGTGKAECNVELYDGITLGCDPEALLINGVTGVYLPAKGYFPSRYGAIGCDGDNTLLEFRPLPSTDEKVLLNSFYRLLWNLRSSINTTDFGRRMWLMAASHYSSPVNFVGIKMNVALSLGFHLHYGLPTALLGWGNRFIGAEITKVLDYYTGIPSILPEDYQDSIRRTKPFSDYGKPGNFRLNNRTLEYRVPGGVLLKHPLLTQGIIAIGAVVIEDIISRLRELTDNFTNLGYAFQPNKMKELYPNLPNIYQIFEALGSPSSETAERHVPIIRRGLENMAGYGRRAKSIEDFFAIAAASKGFSKNIESNWWRYYHGSGQQESVGVRQSSSKATA